MTILIQLVGLRRRLREMSRANTFEKVKHIPLGRAKQLTTKPDPTQSSPNGRLPAAALFGDALVLALALVHRALLSADVAARAARAATEAAAAPAAFAISPFAPSGGGYTLWLLCAHALAPITVALCAILAGLLADSVTTHLLSDDLLISKE
ncbi:hypothetical protein T492DRAFT_840185 [Pavlovales sp. CCMP2436]|nr:hypothetical protein T492DRAFT_840185 [Pavlovales sp. CCMP2436]